MNAETKKIRESLVYQLSSFEARLDSKDDGVEVMADIQAAIGQLLSSNGGSEAAIRRILQERFDSGDLRKETFRLVKSMLDRYVTEEAPTSSFADAAESTGGDDLDATMIIPVDASIRALSADDRVQVGSLLRDRYMLRDRVSGGSMGVVYKALDRRLAEGNVGDSWVAVKVISPQLAANEQALRALQQEAAKGRCLTHPNIVRFIDLDRDDDLYFIVMEWLDGQTLANILDAPGGGGIDKIKALRIVEQIGQALDYAHRCGIVHADVKPGNIMIMPNGDAKLFDFGVARVRQKQMQGQSEFDPGVLGLLTPAYSSMQVLTGDDPAPADDVFSLACLLYRLVAGYRVFGPRNAAEAAEEGMKPQRLKNFSEKQWRVLKKALAYSRVTRCRSMSDFLDALDIEAAISDSKAISTITKVPIETTTRVPVETTTRVPVEATTRVPVEATTEVSVKVASNDAVVVSHADDTDKNPPIKISVPPRNDPEPELNLELDPHSPGAFRYVAGFIILLGILGGAGWKFGLLDDMTQQLVDTYPAVAEQLGLTVAPDRIIAAQEPVESAMDLDETAVAATSVSNSAVDASTQANSTTDHSAVGTAAIDDAESDAAAPDTTLVDSGVIDGNANQEKSDAEFLGNEPPDIGQAVAIERPTFDVPALVDFSKLPAPTTELRISFDGSSPKTAAVTLRENGRPVTVDIIRSDATFPLVLRIEEVRFSGNRSPWESGQFRVSGDGFLQFPAGQDRARITLSMSPDPVREADQHSTLRIREVNNPMSELAIINALLEDDDQRAFEATLPPNTVAFATSQVTVREQDPVVQIDVIRFNPDDKSLTVGYILRDITATEGEDYFAPSGRTVEFGRGGRTARILIPLVQDSEYEDNEAFSVELIDTGPIVSKEIFRRTAVLIRDDDS